MARPSRRIKAHLGLPLVAPFHLPPFTKSQLYAVGALQTGTANDGQQKTAWHWITQTLCPLGRPTFDPGSQKTQDFAEGMRFVALVMTAMADNLAVLEKEAVKEELING